MIERPILFNDEMVRAILDGRKTQTRRVADFPPKTTRVYWADTIEVLPKGEPYTGWVVECDAPLGLPRKCPYGTSGDRLWVRECFYCDDFRYPNGPIDEMKTLLEYRATHRCGDWEAGCPCRDDDNRSSWRPSIHMPRWASRITLEITNVRVERVQEISDEDAKAEGILPLGNHWNDYRPEKSRQRQFYLQDPRDSFRTLWDSINSKRGYGWEQNPWIWVIEFKHLKG